MQQVIRAVSQQVTTAKDLPDKNSLSPSDDNPQIKVKLDISK